MTYVTKAGLTVGTKPEGLLEGEAAERCARASVARAATAKLVAWSAGTIERAYPVAARADDDDVGAPSAVQVNGVAAALSPAYADVFGGLAANVIAVEAGLLRHNTRTTRQG